MLDSGCTKTVCGNVWLQYYLDTLSEDDLSHVVTKPSKNMFKFGDSKMIKSTKMMHILVRLAGVPIMSTTDVIDYDIPLLLSKETMKKANTQIDFKEDKLCIFGKKLDIKFSSSGHYCIDIDKINSSQTDNYNIVLLCN